MKMREVSTEGPLSLTDKKVYMRCVNFLYSNLISDLETRQETSLCKGPYMSPLRYDRTDGN